MTNIVLRAFAVMRCLSHFEQSVGMEKGLKISLFGPHVTMAVSARASARSPRSLVTGWLVRRPAGKLLDIEILLGKRNLDLVFIEFLVDLLV